MSPRPSGKSSGSTREKVYEYVAECIHQGMPPTVREVQEALGFKAVQSAREHLEKLVDEGRLTKSPGQSRGYGLPDWQPYNPMMSDQMIPILGRVQAGALTQANEDIEGYLPYAQEGGTREELFALRVQGESMIGAGIYPDDVVIVRWQSTANIGDIVVAMVDDEATVKTYWYKNGQIELRPENPDFEVIRPDPQNCSILGIVVELRRFFRDTPYIMEAI